MKLNVDDTLTSYFPSTYFSYSKLQRAIQICRRWLGYSPVAQMNRLLGLAQARRIDSCMLDTYAKNVNLHLHCANDSLTSLHILDSYSLSVLQSQLLETSLYVYFNLSCLIQPPLALAMSISRCIFGILLTRNALNLFECVSLFAIWFWWNVNCFL